MSCVSFQVPDTFTLTQAEVGDDEHIRQAVFVNTAIHLQNVGIMTLTTHPLFYCICKFATLFKVTKRYVAPDLETNVFRKRCEIKPCTVESKY